MQIVYPTQKVGAFARSVPCRRTALVTGGTGALGRAISVELGRAGYRVIAACRHAHGSNMDAFNDLIEHDGDGCFIETMIFDVADYADTERAIAQAGAVDVLVNAAGITRDCTLRKMSPQQWAEVIKTNLDSVFNTTRCVINGMIERGFGRIINISSINGQKGQMGQANYSASKAGMHGFTMALAQEVAAKGVTVNTVSPGYIDSPMIRAVPDAVRERIQSEIPVRHFGCPRDVARVVAFLAAEDAGFITGANIPANGGHHMGI